MNKENLLLYICVPVYKTEAYIRDCIRSVLDQTYGNYQLVLVDDGSPDHAGKICDDYAKGDSRITVFHQENKGLICARDTALNYVRKQPGYQESFVIFLDSDDTLKNNALETIADTVVRERCDMVVYGMERVCNGEIVYRKAPPHEETISDKKTLYHIFFGNNYYNSLCCKSISGNLLCDDEKLTENSYIKHGEDLYRSIFYYKNCRRVAFIKDALYNYTVNPASITEDIRYDVSYVDSTVRRAVWDFLKEENVWDEQSFVAYQRYLRKLLNEKLRTISAMPTCFENKVKMFEKINADEYYQMLIAGSTRKDIAIRLLSRNKYKMLYLFARCDRMLRTMYHRICRK